MIISQHDKNNSFRTGGILSSFGNFYLSTIGHIIQAYPNYHHSLKKTDKKKLYIPSGNTELLAVSGLNITLSIFS